MAVRRAAQRKRGARAVQRAVESGLNVTTDVGGSIATAWDSIRANLRRDCGARTFDGWLRPIALGDFDKDSGTLRLQLPSQFMADWVQTHFAERLTLAWKARLPEVRQIRIGVGPGRART